MASDDVLVINGAQMKERVRATRSGPGKMSTVITMSVKSEPITYNINEKFLLQQAAEALARQVREQTQAIAAPVKESTAKARRTQERAFANGERWAVKRFSGGRTGVTPPKVGSVQAYNHSGRLADSIVARYVEKTREFYINYAANRWNPKDWPSLDKMRLAIDRWIAMVPVLREPSADLEVQRAFVQTHREMVQKHREGIDHQIAMRRIRILNEALRVAVEILGG